MQKIKNYSFLSFLLLASCSSTFTRNHSHRDDLSDSKARKPASQDVSCLELASAIISKPKVNAKDTSLNFKIDGRLSLAEKKNFEPRGQEVHMVESFSESFNKGLWDNHLLDPSKTNLAVQFRLGYGALKKGLISENQFASLSIRLAAWKSLVLDNQITPKTLEIISESGHLTEEGRKLLSRLSPSDSNFSSRTPLPGMTTGELETFEARLSKLPRSEHFFWIIPINESNKYYSEFMMATDVRYNPFFIYPDDALEIQKYDDFEIVSVVKPPTEIIVQNMGAMQTYLDTVYGPSAIKLLPELGATSRMQVLEGIQSGGRVLGLHSPEEKGFTIADVYEAGKYFFSVHDWGHAATGSQSPKFYRQVMARIGIIALQMTDENHPHLVNIRKILKKMNIKFTKKELDDFVIFADSVNYPIPSKMPISDLFKELDRDFKIIDPDSLRGDSDKFMSLFFIDISLNPDIYKKFGIDLKKIEKSMSNYQKDLLQNVLENL